VKERLEQRLIELKNEFESGQKMLAELDAKQAALRETLLRISGAIQVLEEELARFSDAPATSLRAANPVPDPADVSGSLSTHVKRSDD
jgi:predicted nuclease with TOPRIM domain